MHQHQNIRASSPETVAITWTDLIDIRVLHPSSDVASITITMDPDTAINVGERLIAAAGEVAVEQDS